MNLIYKLIELPTISDSRGQLTVFDEMLPFKVARVYWIQGVAGETRGGHRHKVTRQALIAIVGKIFVSMNDGVGQDTICLDSPSKCLLIEPTDWHEMKFDSGSILLVISSHGYDHEDYINEKY